MNLLVRVFLVERRRTKVIPHVEKIDEFALLPICERMH